ncbi:MAG: hypothetical protein SGPRY_009452, partial [Prymnesium sp.]
LVAAQHVNAREESVVPALSSLLGNITLEVSLQDSGYEEATAIQSYRQTLADGSHAIVGPSRSAVSQPLAQLGKCSYASSSVSLSNKALYPYFGRTYPSDAIAAVAVIRVISSFGWKQFAVLHSNDAYANSFAERLRTAAPASGVNVLSTVSYEFVVPSTYGPAVGAVRDSGANIIVGLVWSSDFIGIWQHARAQGLFGAGFVWITTDIIVASVLNGHVASAAIDQVDFASSVQGVLNIYPSPASTPGYARFTSAMRSTNSSACSNSRFTVKESMFTSDLYYMGAYVYDCVAALAIALSNSDDPSDGDEVLQQFRRTQFSGASGIVAFDPNTTDRLSVHAEYLVINWQSFDNRSLGEATVASFSEMSGLAFSSTAVKWLGGSSVQPVDVTSVEPCRKGLVSAFGNDGQPLCKPCPSDQMEFEGKRCIPKVATLGVITPFTNGYTGEMVPRADFKYQVCAALLAAAHVNARETDVVPEMAVVVSNLTQITMNMYDSGMFPFFARLSYNQMKEEDVQAFVGAQSSSNSIELAEQAVFDRLPQCSFKSSSEALSDVVNYPYCAQHASLKLTGITLDCSPPRK